MNYKLFRILYGVSFAFWLLSFYLAFWLLTQKFSDITDGFALMGLAIAVVIYYFIFLSISVLSSITAEFFRKRSFKSIFLLISAMLLSACLSRLLLPFITYHIINFTNWKFLINSELVGRSAPPLSYVLFSSIGIPIGITIWLIIDRNKGEPKDVSNPSPSDR